MKRVMWYGLLGFSMFFWVGCQDEVKTIQQKEQVHESRPRMEVIGGGDASSAVPDEPPLAAGRWPGAPKGVTAQAALMARRAAELDAYRKLAEMIKGLRIDSRTYVKDFVTESDTINADTVAHIRGVTFTRYDFPPGGGICEAEAAVRLSSIVTYLRELHTRDIKGGQVKGIDYNTMRQVNNKSIVAVTGQGAIRGQ
jgi:hypothetical protein